MSEHYGEAGFDFDVTVSVFEATIRILGGLLSAHLLAESPNRRLYPHRPNGAVADGPVVKALDGNDDEFYDGSLLPLARDLAERMMPAFDTPTGMPYGSVNLRRGVSANETTVASLAGAGSLSLEFMLMSELSDDPSYGCAARKALVALYEHRAENGLVGKHIDIESGDWVEATAGIGSTADSFYEYMAKTHLVFGDNELWSMFSELVSSIDAHTKFGPWYVDVDLVSGLCSRPVFDSLQGFWPGLMALVGGDVADAATTLNAFLAVFDEHGAVPEEFDWLRWQLPSAGSGGRSYPLRPELIESVVFLYQATRDESWLVRKLPQGAIFPTFCHYQQRHYLC